MSFGVIILSPQLIMTNKKGEILLSPFLLLIQPQYLSYNTPQPAEDNWSFYSFIFLGNNFRSCIFGFTKKMLLANPFIFP